MDDTIYKIAIAALLHDIGKFAERGGFHVPTVSYDLHSQRYLPYVWVDGQKKYTHRHAAYTAAFIDQIEKYLPKAFNKSEWGLGDDFMNIAAGHHHPESPLQWVVAMADRIASGFDRVDFDKYNEEDKIAVRDYKKTRMLSLFEGLSASENWKKNKLEDFAFRYPLKELSPTGVFPMNSPDCIALDDEKASAEYENLLKKVFIPSIGSLIHKENIPLWLDHFDSLFMVCASNIPSATVGATVPDISLYDHSRMTAAIAVAIFLYHQKSLEIERIREYTDNKFLVVSGDFYGIQDFIFAQAGSTNRAAAKLLRGRSFAVSLMSELAADMLCRRIGLPSTSVILNAAGKFTILAPNTDAVKDAVRAVEAEINKWLAQRFFGEAAMGFACIEASPDDFVSRRFADLWDRLGRESKQKKSHRIDLGKYGGVVQGYLDSFDNKLDSPMCPFCGRRPSSAEAENDRILGEAKSACKLCRDHIYIGTKLVRAKRIAVASTDADIKGDKLLEPVFGVYQVAMDVTGKLSDLARDGKLFKYWDISIAKDGNVTKDVTAKFVSGYVPVYGEYDLTDERLSSHGGSDEIVLGAPKTFNHLARKALNRLQNADNREKTRFSGVEALGILKADVDNLGLLFACGLQRQQQSLSRLATFSRFMNGFFSIYLPHLLGTEARFNDVYTVFAGGDDLFLIGPWNRIIDLLAFLQDKFREYVCENPDVIWSVGVSVNKPDDPVRTLHNRSEAALKLSKKTRDSITVFGESVTWNAFRDLLKIKKTIEDWNTCGIVNNAMLFRFNTFIELLKRDRIVRSDFRVGAKKAFDLEDMHCLAWRALFKYTVARNVGKELDGDERKRAVETVEAAVDWLVKYGSAMKIPLWPVIYEKRIGG